ncbi:hypothetical protein FVE85_6055 [Porphyridium purpureum]|uniref:Uncharacterized protein n=1 Tax=Porphyridium purpureum TaxID=35688 RepID=A0A5J4Z5F2_PORPP|nr:hypothetical protein FVE85_6055 [Porphyridium purpureum]|eukprot:POR4410..scf295_1
MQGQEEKEGRQEQRQWQEEQGRWLERAVHDSIVRFLRAGAENDAERGRDELAGRWSSVRIPLGRAPQTSHERVCVARVAAESAPHCEPGLKWGAQWPIRFRLHDTHVWVEVKFQHPLSAQLVLQGRLERWVVLVDAQLEMRQEFYEYDLDRPTFVVIVSALQALEEDDVPKALRQTAHDEVVEAGHHVGLVHVEQIHSIQDLKRKWMSHERKNSLLFSNFNFQTQLSSTHAVVQRRSQILKGGFVVGHEAQPANILFATQREFAVETFSQTPPQNHTPTQSVAGSQPLAEPESHTNSRSGASSATVVATKSSGSSDFICSQSTSTGSDVSSAVQLDEIDEEPSGGVEAMPRAKKANKDRSQEAPVRRELAFDENDEVAEQGRSQARPDVAVASFVAEANASTTNVRQMGQSEQIWETQLPDSALYDSISGAGEESEESHRYSDDHGEKRGLVEESEHRESPAKRARVELEAEEAEEAEEDEDDEEDESEDEATQSHFANTSRDKAPTNHGTGWLGQLKHRVPGVFTSQIGRFLSRTSKDGTDASVAGTQQRSQNTQGNDVADEIGLMQNVDDGVQSDHEGSGGHLVAAARPGGHDSSLQGNGFAVHRPAQPSSQHGLDEADLNTGSNDHHEVDDEDLIRPQHHRAGDSGQNEDAQADGDEEEAESAADSDADKVSPSQAIFIESASVNLSHDRFTEENGLQIREGLEALGKLSNSTERLDRWNQHLVDASKGAGRGAAWTPSIVLFAVHISRMASERQASESSESADHVSQGSSPSAIC